MSDGGAAAIPCNAGDEVIALKVGGRWVNIGVIALRGHQLVE